MPSFHATRQWRRLAAACLRRQPVCWTPECGYPSAHVNHIIPRASGGRDTPMNLRGLCDACHNSRSGRSSVSDLIDQTEQKGTVGGHK